MRNNEDRLSGLVTQQETTAVQSTGLSFVTPTEFVDLPSKGKLYSVGHPLHKKVTIEIKQMTAKEEDILTSESYIKKGVVLEKFLESIIVDKSIRPEDLTTSDRSAIFLAARILAYGPEYKVSTVCPKCSKKKDFVYDLLQHPKIEPVPEELQLTDKGTFFIELPNTKWVVECRSLTGKDENKFEKNKVVDNAVSTQLKSLVVSINGVTDKALLEQAISVIPAKDSVFLRAKFKNSMPSVNFSFNLECECDFVGEVDVPITLEFFWPKS